MSLYGNLRLGLCTAAAILAGTALTSEPFTDLARGFDGQFRASSAERGPITAGTEAVISGSRLVPGQVVTFRQGGEVLAGGEALTVGETGELEATVTIPAGAAPGLYPVVAELDGPDYATTFEIKVSPVLEPVGAFDLQSAPLARNPYQVAVGSDALFVTSAVGRPPVKESVLMKLDPETFEVLAQVSPEAAPDREDGREGGLFAVYGVGYDEASGQVWVTNTRQDTVAVYSAADLSLLKQFEPGTVGHPRDAVAHKGKVYVSATFEPLIHVFDTATMEELEPIALSSSRRREEFGTASLQLDAASDALYVVSLTTEEVAEVDLTTGAQANVWPVNLSKSTIGVGHDPKSGRIFTVGQGSDNLVILDDQTGEVLHEVMVGANPLNVAFDPATDLAWIVTRGSGTLVGVTPDGEIAAALEVGPQPNHLAVDGKGGVLVVTKGGGETEADNANALVRVTPKG